jgi:hypothetical protein
MNEIDYLCNTIDLNNVKEGYEFERHFYRAFNKLKDQRFTRKIWNWDDDQQTIRFKIPNDQISIYNFKNDREENVIYIGAIYNRNYCQFDKFGFDSPKEAGNYVEVLTLFSTLHFDGNLFNLERVFLKEFCYDQAKLKGADSVIATCSPLLLKLYLKWNFRVTDTLENEYGTRHLIQMDL